MNALRVAAVSMALVILASACAGADQPVESATPSVTTTTTASIASTTSTPIIDGAETRSEILKLALPTFGGETFNPDSMAGKNVLLWFWGPH